MRAKAVSLFKNTQNVICAALEKLDGKETFQEDAWIRPDTSGGHGGGGITRIIAEGSVIEKGGVNFSEVHGELPAVMSKRLVNIDAPSPFYATGVSLVIHPYSPMIPTVHANFRYLEVAGKSWFGGGTDLTPYYLYEEDAVHFHTTLKNTCDIFNEDFYPKFKKRCDEYFYLPHREEARGIGGIFLDYLGKEDPEKIESHYDLIRSLSESFLPAYLPIAEKRLSDKWGEAEKEFQLIRRGRYVEFNLIFDLGTQFGLKTGGRAESILMSLPPNVRWNYNCSYKEGSKEFELIEALKKPRNWI